MFSDCANKCFQNGGAFGCEICYRNDFRYIEHENEIETDTETEIDKENQLGVQDLNAGSSTFPQNVPHLSISFTYSFRKGQLTVYFYFPQHN